MDRIELYINEMEELFLLPDEGEFGYSGLEKAPLESAHQFRDDCGLISRYDTLAQDEGIIKHPRALLAHMITDAGMALVAVYEGERANLMGAYNNVAAEYLGDDADEWDS